jgi:hypothetical protein
LLEAHSLEIAIFTQKERIRRRDKLSLFEVGKVDHICVIVVDLQKIVHVPIIVNWLDFVLCSPLLLPLLDQRNDFKVEETDVVDIFEERFYVVACKFIDFGEEMFSHFYVRLD